MSTFVKGDKVVIYDEDDEAWHLGIIIRVISDWQGYNLKSNFYPIHLPDEHERVYCVQYYDQSGEELWDQVGGIYVGMEWIHSKKLIVPDSPMARIIYLSDNYE